MYLSPIDVLTRDVDRCEFPDDEEIESPRYDYRPNFRPSVHASRLDY